MQYLGRAAVIGAMLVMLSHGAVAKDEVGRPVLFRLEAQPLPVALNAWAEQAGLQVIWQPDTHARQLVSTRVTGTLDPESALKELLKGSGLTYSFVDARTVAIRPEARTLAKEIAWSEREGQLTTSERVPTLPLADSSAQPQENSTSSADDAAAKIPPDEVVVTGTHIRGSSAAGSKVLVIDRQAIESSGYGRVHDVLRTLTQNFNGNTDELGQPSASNFNRGAEVQLRGLGTGTTLTLVNGQRQASGGAKGTFIDISSIATSAIERIEVLPEGASAIYGSDAIGGVVNIILRKDFDGLETGARFSSAEGEADEKQISQLFGHAWSNGHALVGYQYYERDPLPYAARPYTAANYDLRRFGGGDFRQVTANPGTIVNPSTLAPISAIPSGQNGTNLTSSQLITPGVNYADLVTLNVLTPEQQMHTAFINASYGITGTWALSFDGRYAKRDFESRQNGEMRTLSIPATNAFNRQGTAVAVAYDFTSDLGPRVQYGTTETYFASTGIGGALGAEWNLNLAMSYAKEANDFYWSNRLTSDSAILNPFLGSNVPSTALNVFGEGSNTNPAVLDAIRLTNYENTLSKVYSGNMLVDGPLFRLPSGAVRLAIGGDYRKESLSDHDRLTTNALPRDVDRTIFAAFAEFAVPIFGSSNGAGPLGRMDLSLAGRYEDYEDFGTTFDPKFGLSWRPWEALKLRGTWGTSFRAPPFHRNNLEFNTSRATVATTNDPLSPTGRSQVLALQGNDPNLTEETAEVWTTGFDFFVPFITNLSLSATYFNIDYDNKIEVPGPSSQLLPQEARWTSIITRTPTQAQIDAACASVGATPGCATAGTIAAIIDVRTRNIAVVKVHGVDVDLSYQLPTALGQWGFDIRGTYMMDYDQATTPTSPLVHDVNTVGKPLKHRYLGRLSWNLGNWGAAATVNYAGSYSNRNSALPIVSKVDSWTTVDLHLGYTLDARHGWLDNTRFSVGAVNLLGGDPPFINNGNTGYDATNATLLGRQVSVQVIKEWGR